MFYQGLEKREGPFWGVVPDRGIRPHLTNLGIHASGLSIVSNQSDFPDETCEVKQQTLPRKHVT